MSYASIAILIMAAGQSSRFDGCKFLADVNGLPLIQHAIDSANSLPSDVFVVTGAWHNELADRFKSGLLTGAEILHAGRWTEGLGGSISSASDMIAPNYQKIIIMLADQIAITGDDLFKLVENSQQSDAVCGHYGDKRGVPALFNQQCFGALRQLSGDTGAKQLLYSGSLNVVSIGMPNGEVDIDTPTDLSHWLQSSASSILR